MEWLLIPASLIWFVIGWYVGKSRTIRTYRTDPIGTLRIDTSDPDGPYLFLELDKGVGDISTKEYVRLRVSTESYIPRN